MKIAYMSLSEIPSTQANSVQVMKMCNAFTNKGNNVVLYCRKGKLSTDEYLYYGVHDSFKTVKIPFLKIKGIGLFIYANRLYNSFIDNKNNTDIIYGREFLSLYKLRNSGLPIVLESHMIPQSKLQKYLTGKLLKSKNFVCLIVTADELKEQFQKFYPWCKNIHVVGNASDYLQSNTRVLIKGGMKPKVGYIGNLMPGKGMDLIVSIASEMPEIEFHIVGGNEQDVKYWSKLTTENVILYGHVGNASLGSYYDQFDLLIAPYVEQKLSYRNIEVSKFPSPLKIIEYMAANKPIIASNLKMVNSTLTHQENALLCNPDSISEWVSAIHLLISNPKLAENLAENAYNKFRDNHTWNKRAGQIIEIINQHLIK